MSPRTPTRAHLRGVPVAALLVLGALNVAAPATAAPRRAARATTLVIQSAVEGAEVEVDGQQVGTTPLALPLALRPGVHVVRVRRLGYAPFESTVRLRPGREARLKVDLRPVLAVLRVNGEPMGARITLDGRLVGLVPFLGEVEAGPALLEVRAVGYRGYADRLALAPGAELVRRVLLAPSPEGIAGAEPPGLYPEPVSPADPWYSSGWLWAAVGVVAAGAVVAAVATRRPAGSPPDRTLTFDPVR